MTTERDRATILQLVYASAETSPFSDEELMALLEQSRQANEARNVTGMLLYHEGSFIQALEGEPETVRSLYDKIARDGRHHNERVIYEVEQDERNFDGWTLGFHRIDAASEAPDGIDQFLETGELGLTGDDHAVLRQILLGFRDGAYHRTEGRVTDQRVRGVGRD